MSKKSNTVWSSVVDYINTVKNGENISRKDLGDHCWYYSSVDVYRNTLCHLGFLKWKDVGIYTKIRSIPLDLTSAQAKTIASNKNNDIVKYHRKLKIENIIVD